MKALFLSTVFVLQIALGGLPTSQVGLPDNASHRDIGGAAPYALNIADEPPLALGLNAPSTVIVRTPTGGGPPAVGAVAITPSLPQKVNQGATFQFKANVAGTWSCSGTDGSGNVSACQGSIDPSTGLYTAPAAVIVKQSAGGMQMLPNNHVFNTRIDSLPTRSDSGRLISGAGTVTLSYLPSFPLNYANESTPIESEVFLYTPSNNGKFEMPAYPNAKIENGWFSARRYNPFNGDHHLLVLDTTSGTAEEMYQYYPARTNSMCGSCTSQSGHQYSNSSYSLPSKGATNAAGTDLWPLTLRLQELEQAAAIKGTINHAVQMTLQNGYMHNAFLWPATTSVNAGSGANYYGERIRLKSNFKISGYSAIAQILLTQLKQYGLILTDGGLGWQVSVEYTRWPKEYADAFKQIEAGAIGPSNFEVVDESGLEFSPSSGETTTNRETVAFTRSSDSAKATVDVILTGVAVNLPQDALFIQAGTGSRQFSAFANIGSVSWSMSPSLGTLTLGGVYTPPANVSSPQSTTITVTSTVNTSVAAQMNVVIYPRGVIRLAPGQPSNYLDSAGNTWFRCPLCGGDASSAFGTESAFGYSNGGSWPSTPDIRLYEAPIYAYNDLRFDFIVPNGRYQIVGKFANNSGNNPNDMGNFLIETQGIVLSMPTDVYNQVGNNTPFDFSTTVTVTNSQLSFVLRVVNTSGAKVAPFISALEVIPINGAN